MVAVEMPVGKVKKKMKVDKMDDEGVKENLAKKERKSKRGQATAPEREASSIDEESLGGMKKKKKNQAKTTVKVEESLNLDGGGEKREKEKKKKNFVPESDANCHDVKENNGNDKGISKKKKKLKSEEENAGEIAQGSVKEERDVENEHKKQKKIKKKSLQFEPVEEIVMGEGGEKEGAEKQVGKDEVMTKAKKRKTKALVESTEETDEQSKVTKKRQKTTEKKEKKTAKPTEESEDTTVVPKKKSKKSDENEQRLVTLEEETDVVEEVTVKKKAKTKLKAATKEEAKEAGTQEIQHKTKRKKAGKGKEVFNAVTEEEIEGKEIKPTKRSKSTNSVNDIVEEEREPERKEKKGLKEKRGKAVKREEEPEGSGIEEKEPKKKRKKASSKGEEEETSLQQVKEEGQSVETFITVAGDTKGKKKNKKKSSEVEMKVANEKEAEEGVETSAKKRKKQKIKLEPTDDEEQEDQGVCQMDVVFLSEKTGNSDEVTINQERRLALQMEIDKASVPLIPAKPSGFGQWGTAQFDNSEQQQKFLRLMGGFKKGTQPTGANTGRANMALGKEAQQGVQQALLGEFERAQSRRMDFNGRGAGLGFTAPSNKKFSIDINASRSIHFD